MLIMATSVCTSDDGNCKDGTQAIWVDGAITGSIFAGSIVGMLSMGYIGDMVGRNNAFLITLAVAVLGALTSVVCAYGDAETIYAVIASCRFVLGFGVGGVFPLSFAKACEDSVNAGDAGADNEEVDIIAACIAGFFQVPGAITPWFVGFLLSHSSMSVANKWRLMLALGTIPSAMAMACTWYEIQLRKKSDAGLSGSVDNSTSDSKLETGGGGLLNTRTLSSISNVPLSTMDPKYIRLLWVTGGSWFIYDVAYYGVALFAGIIVDSLKDGDDDSIASDSSYRHATTFQIYALLTGIPGGLMTVFAIKYYGPKFVQICGFTFTAIMFFIMAMSYAPLKKENADLLFFIYCMLMLSLNSGTSMTVSCIPCQIFPFAIRATCVGITAACGKLGGLVGSYMVCVKFALVIVY